MLFTIAKGCEFAAYDMKKLTDDRVILRRDAGGADFLPTPVNGRTTLDADDCAVLIRYAHDRRSGQPVKFAGLNASRLQTAMREYPDSDRLTIVTLDNGLTFTLPADKLDLSTGYNSGGYVATALTVHVGNLRAQVQRAVEAYEPVIGGEDE